ncbi:signal recognition particle-docking protein FtsY [Candidatus Pantoea symbiotica]|jgi:fused signal recognition particle receptor|uniref:Signal recognition particle receptor FtsY n=1 Tax=Candidatus Pantoea symbiotica TaxID=1884370 RepID=A0A1I4CP11_9GAMM|nr:MULTISPECIES: signal recognition particle-docking protein FtsY [Pantoea]KAJ9430959.1 signal recognition particle-docking protein FtsY [Pantoea sp. YR343]MRT25130.1 signal recognition particle-docking protein FtsY [Enterobacteriaceae bacterium RIT697]SFK82655.1 signal recognition particle-docking protein FtsY [Pantoea symbiotica]SFV02954.1 signal recognition particle-docking protein FtsY [Pantoea sp. YR525]
MAKEKKRGFFSWLGFGKEEETQQPAEEQQQTTEVVAEPAVEESALDRAEAQAVETVAVTEQVAEQQQVEPELIEEPVIEPHEPEPVTAIVEEVLPEEITQPDVAPIEEEPQLEELALDEPELDEEAPLTDEELEALALAETYAEDAELAEATQDTVSDLPLAAAPMIAQEQERPTKEGFFARLKRSLVKTRENLGSGFISLFRGKKIDDDLFEELEEQLLIADVGVETTRRIITNLTQQANRKQLRDAEALYGLLKAEMSGILEKVDQPLEVGGKTPFVILMVGVNGVGKTTTIGKLARQYQAQGKSVMLAAGDTFRAAAVEQLQVWGQRNNIPVVAQHTGADSASVIFDAIQAAKSRNVDVLIADTAGRLQNKSHLMEELKKITRVMKKLDEDAPHEVMLTLDASTGQNAISQAKLFHEAVGLTGITLTKLDGTAKGGVIFSVADQFGIPIRYIGVGEGIEDLRPFKAADFIEALFAREE